MTDVWQNGNNGNNNEFLNVLTFRSLKTVFNFVDEILSFDNHKNLRSLCHNNALSATVKWRESNQYISKSMLWCVMIEMFAYYSQTVLNSDWMVRICENILWVENDASFTFCTTIILWVDLSYIRILCSWFCNVKDFEKSLCMWILHKILCMSK